MPSFTKIYHHKPYPSIHPTRLALTAEGKVTLITGAGLGVGEATAHAFAQAGAKAVILCGRRLEPLQKVKADIESNNSGAKVVVHSLDITKEADINQVFEQVQAKYGPVDGAVNSAGHLSDKGTVAESTLANFCESFEITCKGGFFVARAFLETCSRNSPQTRF